MRAQTIKRIFGGKIDTDVEKLLGTFSDWIHDYDSFIAGVVLNESQAQHSPEDFYAAIKNAIGLRQNMLYNFAEESEASGTPISKLPDFQQWVKGFLPDVIRLEVQKLDYAPMPPPQNLMPGTVDTWMSDDLYQALCEREPIGPSDGKDHLQEACALYKDGKRVLLRSDVRGGTYRILAVVDPKTGAVQGDPYAKMNRDTLRIQRGLYEEPTVKAIQSEFGEQGVQPFTQTIRKVMPGIIEINTPGGFCGGAYVGKRNGASYFITAAHCVGPQGSSATVTTPFGTFTGTVAYRGSFPQNDVATVVANDPMIDRFMKPIPIAPTSSPYGVAVTGFLREGDLLRRPGNAHMYYDRNRYRPGYSGGPVIDAEGRIIGVSSGLEGNQIFLTDLNSIRTALGATGRIK